MPVVPPNRSFRRLIRILFASFLKHQNSVEQDEYRATVLEKLRDIEDSIEIMAREMARWARSN